MRPTPPPAHGALTPGSALRYLHTTPDAKRGTLPTERAISRCPPHHCQPPPAQSWGESGIRGQTSASPSHPSSGPVRAENRSLVFTPEAEGAQIFFW
ncbi:hypothetical protein SKAU_G00109090 [Synaphobranchus kaupii]|uniref:Uncharacterized protein n=1 Tax=Synaphobranchus kaupii TaxID=118154 RepID=A0A9Q1G155_SYNKA|nr:hypothetical protein SKAU_G00109090 [Synaphobranchus kaupii]